MFVVKLGGLNTSDGESETNECSASVSLVCISGQEGSKMMLLEQPWSDRARVSVDDPEMCI